MNQQIRIWLVLFGCLLLSACIAPVEQVKDCSTTDPFSEKVQADSYWVSCELIITGIPDEIEKTLASVELTPYGFLQEFLVLKEQDEQQLIDPELANLPAFRHMLAVEWGFQSLPDDFVEQVRSTNDALSIEETKQVFLLMSKLVVARQNNNNPDRFQKSLDLLGVKINDEMISAVQREIDNYSGLPTQEQLEKLMVRRYAVTQHPLAVSDVIQAINGFRLADGKEFFVFAEPNFLTTLAPHTIANGPFGAPVMAGSFGVGNQEFQEQWAFQLITDNSLDQPTTFPIQEAAGEIRGQGVRVVLFDTSPFADEQFMEFTQIVPPLRLVVLNPALEALSPPPNSKSVDPGINKHGLFVAGLVHAIVPESEIYLVRTSLDGGHGTLHDLSQALVAAVFNAHQDDVPNLVINISGGVFCPKNCWQELVATSCTSGESGNAQRCSEEIEEIAYLSIPLLVAKWVDVLKDDFTVVVVAAAGNDSAVSNVSYPPFPPQNPPYEPERPAAYQHVLGIAATTKDNMRSCFSNSVYKWAVDFDLAAPGGNGGLATVPESINGQMISVDYACAPIEHSCAGGGDCLKENGLLSIVSDASGTGDKFAYWSGTSFATPLATGVVALCLSRGEPVAALAKDADSSSPDHSLLGRGRLRIPDSCR